GALEPVRIEAEPRRVDVEAPALLAVAVHDREPVFLASPAEIAARFPTAGPTRPGPASAALAALPLALAGRVIGALVLEFDHPQRFEPDDRRWMIALAQRCAMAIERTRLADDVRRSDERYRLVAE